MMRNDQLAPRVRRVRPDFRDSADPLANRERVRPGLELTVDVVGVGQGHLLEDRHARAFVTVILTALVARPAGGNDGASHPAHQGVDIRARVVEEVQTQLDEIRSGGPSLTGLLDHSVNRRRGDGCAQERHESASRTAGSSDKVATTASACVLVGLVPLLTSTARRPAFFAPATSSASLSPT